PQGRYARRALLPGAGAADPRYPGRVLGPRTTGNRYPAGAGIGYAGAGDRVAAGNTPGRSRTGPGQRLSVPGVFRPCGRWLDVAAPGPDRAARVGTGRSAHGGLLRG